MYGSTESRILPTHNKIVNKTLFLSARQHDQIERHVADAFPVTGMAASSLRTWETDEAPGRLCTDISMKVGRTTCRMSITFRNVMGCSLRHPAQCSISRAAITRMHRRSCCARQAHHIAMCIDQHTFSAALECQKLGLPCHDVLHRCGPHGWQHRSAR